MNFPQESNGVANILGNVLFGGIGVAALAYGRKQSSIQTILLAILLIGFPYFIAQTFILYLVGILLTVALFFFKD